MGILIIGQDGGLDVASSTLFHPCPSQHMAVDPQVLTKAHRNLITILVMAFASKQILVDPHPMQRPAAAFLSRRHRILDIGEDAG